MKSGFFTLGGLVAILASEALGTRIGWAQVPSVLLKRVALNRVVQVAPDGRVTDTLYRSQAASLSYLSLSPSGKFIGLVETTDVESHSRRLVVLDATGSIVRVVNHDVRPYTWCCGTDHVAFITGPYRENDLGFMPTGAYLIDVVNGVERHLDVPPDAYELEWAAFDSTLYFKTTRGYPGSSIVRYDPRTGESRVTGYRDLRFSPSGDYYLHVFPDPSFGPPGIHIFERTTGREVPSPDPSLGGIEGWVFDEGAYLRLKRSRYPQRRGMILGPEVVDGYTIYDVARQAVVARIEDSIRTDIVAPRGVLVLREDSALKPVRSPGEIPRR